MRIKRSTLPVVLLCFLAAGLFGCSEDAPAPSDLKSGERVIGAGKEALPGGTDPVVPAPLEITVMIEPEQPRVGDRLNAYATGAPKKPIFSWYLNGQLLEEDTGSRLSPGSFGKGDEVSLTMISGGEEFSATTTIVNSPPVIKGVKFADPVIHRGVDMVLNPEVEDPDGDEVSLSYTWFVNGDELYGYDENILPGDRFRKGDVITFRILPNDGEEDGEEFASQETVIPNAVPKFVGVENSQLTDNVYSLELKATDADDDPLQFALENAPEGMQVDAETGKISWQVTELAPVAADIRIVVTDDEGSQVVRMLTLQRPKGVESSP